MKDELGILKEVGSISAGQASIALSELLGRRINLTVPNLDVVSSGLVLNKLSGEHLVVCVFCRILTGIEGKILFILDEKSTYSLVDMCYKSGQDEQKSSFLTEMGLSLIKEVGNVVISSFVGALGVILKTIIIPSIPTLVNGPVQQILSLAVSSNQEYILFIETVFEEPEHKIAGSFYLVLDSNTAQFIQEACKKQLESVNNDD